MSANKSTSKLLAEYRSGNKDEAFAELALRYQPQLQQWLRRSYCATPVDDMVQSVFRELLQEMKDDRTWVRDIAHADSFEKVLYRLACCKLIDRVRYHNRQRRRGTVTDQHAPLDPEGRSFSDSLPDPLANPAEEAEVNLTVRDMVEHVASVNPRWVPVLEAKLKGLKVDDIASAVGMKKRTVELALNGIMNTLREWGNRILDSMEGEE